MNAVQDLRQIGMIIPAVEGFVQPVVDRLAGWMEDSREEEDGSEEGLVSDSTAKVGYDVEEGIDAGNDSASIEGEIISPSVLAMSASSTSTGSTYTPAWTPHEILLDDFDEFEDLPWHHHAYWDPIRVPSPQLHGNKAADIFFCLLLQFLKFSLLLLLPFIVTAMAAAQFALWLGAGWMWWDDVAANVDGYGHGGMESEEEGRAREECGGGRGGGLNLRGGGRDRGLGMI